MNRSQRRWLLVAALVLACGVDFYACGHDDHPQPAEAAASASAVSGTGGLGGGVGGTNGTGGIPDTSNGNVVGAGAYTNDLVDGGGDCAPDAATTFEFTACCNDQPCFGQCYKEDDGGITCRCGAGPEGVSGGCFAGTVCCLDACVAAGSCDFNH